jgi:imidazoleglycerol-phosphate dehydratase
MPGLLPYSELSWSHTLSDRGDCQKFWPGSPVTEHGMMAPVGINMVTTNQKGGLTMAHRTGRVERKTYESDVSIEIDLDGSGAVSATTGIGFFDHMLGQLGKHGLFDLTVRTAGDLHVDSHHTVEDTALALGEAFAIALGDKVGIRRFAQASVPLDEALAQVSVDLSGRPYLVHHEPAGMAPMIGQFDTTLTRHIFESFVAQAKICLHITVPYGRNAHHIVEAQFKGVAQALRGACALDSRVVGVPSTKGAL